MNPTPPKAKKTDKKSESNEAWEQYATERVSGDVEELAAQPYLEPKPDDLAEKETIVQDLPGGGVKITEGSKTKTLNKDSETGALKEAEAGDTFTKNLYSDGGANEGFLNDDARVMAMRQGVIMYRDDPMYRAVIDGFVYFIIGKGLKFKARDENPAVQEHLLAFWKENKMNGRDTDIVFKMLMTGELCIRYHSKGATGAEAKAPRVRLIPFWRIEELKFDPNDPETLESVSVIPYGPALTSHEPEVVLAADIQFFANSQTEGSRGEPPFLVVMRACKWYADFMLNRVVLNRYRTSFVLFKKILGGGPDRVSSVVSGTPNAATKKGKGGQLEKRLPKPGTVVTHNESIEYDWKSPVTGAGDAIQDAKEIRGYIQAGGMVPDFLLGDSTSANQDNSLVSDNPFVRKVEFYQDFFDGVFGEMFKRVIEQGIKTGAIPANSTETKITESGAVMKQVRKLLHRLGVKEATADGNLESVKPTLTKTEVDIEWPTLIQKNEYEQAKTLQLDQTMGLVSVETIRGKRGYDHLVEEARINKEIEAGVDPVERARQHELEAGGAFGDDDEDAEDDEKDPKKKAAAGAKEKIKAKKKGEDE